MRYIPILLIVFAFSCTTETPNKTVDPLAIYDFIADSIGFDTPEEVAIQIVDFLDKKDTSKYLEVILPFEAQKYLAAHNLEYRPDILDTVRHMKWLESRFEDRWHNYFVRANYILDIMREDKGIRIDTSMIDTITFEPERIKNYGGFDRFIVGEWADLDVKLNYKGKVYYFEIPQVIKLKNKWFLYYPEFYIRDENDFKFIKERVKVINQKADEFWL